MKPDPDDPTQLVEIGSPKRVLAELARFNTSPDGASPALGTHRCHGPGFVAEVPASLDEVRQVMVTMTEEDMAWPVLARMCKALGWRMMDPDTGRTFG